MAVRMARMPDFSQPYTMPRGDYAPLWGAGHRRGTSPAETLQGQGTPTCQWSVCAFVCTTYVCIKQPDTLRLLAPLLVSEPALFPGVVRGQPG